MQCTRLSTTMPRMFPSLLAFAFLTYLAINHRLHGQTAAAEHIVVTAEEAGSAYGAPPSFSRSRFSPTTNAYVLPPWAIYTSVIYQGDALRFNRPDHQFTQEVELGLPHRFGVAIENTVEAFRGTTQERTFSIEARYAFADWNKIPLNPTIFVEYKFGIGRVLHDEAIAMHDEGEPAIETERAIHKMTSKIAHRQEGEPGAGEEEFAQP